MSLNINMKNYKNTACTDFMKVNVNIAEYKYSFKLTFL